MFYVKRNIRTAEDGQSFVRICEQNFKQRLAQLVHSVVCDEHPKIITLSGPTCSGKTTTAKKLTAEITASGKNVLVVSIDDFFHDRSKLQNIDGELDFDSIAAIDLPYLAKCLHSLLSGTDTELPYYDFQTGKRGKSRICTAMPEDIIVLEGIQAVYPEITSLLSSYAYKSIFINVTEDISVNDVHFSATDIRLIRRIVRDYRFRAASPDFTLEIWKNVRKNEEENIFPYMGGCDYTINSLQTFELFMIAQFAAPLFSSVSRSSPYAELAEEYFRKLTLLSGNEIDPCCLSEDSLYHEFLG